MNASYYIGVDGGGSGCRAAVVDGTGKILSTGTAGPANATSDFDLAVRNVRDAIADACAGVTDPDGWPTHVGLAGILSDDDGKRFAEALGGQQIQMSDDSATTLAGALAGRDGVVAAIGTGSLFGLSAGGEIRFLGGWGLKIGDQASGAWLGRGLLERIMLVHDGLAEASPLTEMIWARHGRDPNRVVAEASMSTPKDFATLAPDVVRAAAENDPVGLELITEGTSYIDRALRLLDPGPPGVICLTGGLGETYSHWLAPDLSERLVKPAGSALDGALYLAKQI